MADQGGGSPEKRGRRSRLDDYAEMTESVDAEMTEPVDAEMTEPVDAGDSTPLASEAVPPPTPSPGTPADMARIRREFAALLGEFRRTPVLVPLDEDEAPLVGDFGGIRWIYAFSDESALARFAIARGEGAREWEYRRVLGARLLDAGVPATGVPTGVALDVGSDGDGVLFPPVVGIVPDAAAVDAEPGNGEEPQ
ncbi:hypothetical protein ACFYWX_06015 [Streptomyces sp. NPDC002888]|uniref:hypothetical protein n=1 Tax=Streptomyces sp. NPDC002888 TaxID=3364668 RepID=UPI00368C1876